ncbi:leucyl aminopeptidase [Actinobacteria bacterium YIM 96077]|uniref:Probable cytosol aminopeptidase n=1 Tax=Phytoactinopolyspora halophila TaxID=1981511 RepID=A0A329QL53_9ACTN|nr:leucyl aminopeptidase [Phytoactinopolyspora halophila]AYY13695.1 leucyl aminopeptidase [Actinobacteria bacterium YIM 96077]RAW11258.1 leucyl aminopeptidase [Phytoactinopolyspora halophila]
MSTVTLSSANPTGLKVDAIVVATSADDTGPNLLPGAEPVDKALKGSLRDTLARLGATGKADEVVKLPTQGKTKAPVVVAVGTGSPGEPGTAGRREVLRRAAGTAARALSGTASAAFALPLEGDGDAAAVVEGVSLGVYSFDEYKTGDGTERLGAITVVGPGVKAKAVKDSVSRAEVVAAAVNRARDWVNTPPRDLFPKSFAETSTKLAKGTKLNVEVLDEKALARGGYGGLIGVGQGSDNPPRLIRMSYRPARAKKHVVLVGKGITFDTGGISLKSSEGMQTMKSDMGGAAAVVAAMLAVAELAPRVAVTAYAAMAENMPSGKAQRPSDVITIYGGKTVEVLNTDAEGRLVMADALARSGEDEPDLIIDVATLTGAAVVALGTRVAGIMANNDELLRTVYSAAERSGEQMWPLPLPSDLREKLDSQVADIANIGDRNGGALQAGLFLKEFVPAGVDWAHLDIAGPAFNETAAFGYTPKGATGTAVRTLVQIIDDVADGRA